MKYGFFVPFDILGFLTAYYFIKSQGIAKCTPLDVFAETHGTIYRKEGRQANYFWSFSSYVDAVKPPFHIVEIEKLMKDKGIEKTKFFQEVSNNVLTELRNLQKYFMENPFSYKDCYDPEKYIPWLVLWTHTLKISCIKV